MIAAHKTFVTDGTSETFLSCVRAEMSLEFVRTGEPEKLRIVVSEDRFWFEI